MAELFVMPNPNAEIVEDVQANIRKVLDYDKDRGCVGVGVVMIFRDGTSVTFGSKSTNRREMIGAITDLLLDYQRSA